jgi:hypothetical protein
MADRRTCGVVGGGSDTSATDVRVLKCYMAVEFGKVCGVTLISGNIFVECESTTQELCDYPTVGR